MKILFLSISVFVCLTSADNDKHLNEACNKDADCMNSWAYCSSEKKCKCMDGFSSNQDDTLCTYPKRNCPEYLDKDLVPVGREPTSKRVPCEAGYTVNDDGQQTIVDSNCTIGEFCFIHSTNSFTSDGFLAGHCCPTKPLAAVTIDANICPTVTKTVGSCPSSDNDPESCQTKTHECNDVIPDSVTTSCCPLPCQSGLMVDGTGRCYNYLSFGDKCEHTAQCPTDYECFTNSSDKEKTCQIPLKKEDKPKLNKKLNEQCDRDSDCMNAYAHCSSSKKCMCSDEYPQSPEGTCKPSGFYCPGYIIPMGNEERLKAMPAGEPCETGLFDNDGKLMLGKSNCSSSSAFCFLHSNVLSGYGMLYGHCCPLPPQGSNYKLTQACPTLGGIGGRCPSSGDHGTCPDKTHKCFDDIPFSQNKSCCPLSCPEGSFEIAGTDKCFTKKVDHERCQYAAECPADRACYVPTTSSTREQICATPPVGKVMHH
jgi:hypothetical protein